MKDIKHKHHKKHTHHHKSLLGHLDAPEHYISQEHFHDSVPVIHEATNIPYSNTVAVQPKVKVNVKPVPNNVNHDVEPEVKKEETSSFWNNLGTAGEIASSALVLKNMLGGAPVAEAATRFVPFEGPAVGIPISGAPAELGGAIASQAFQNLAEGIGGAAIPEIGAEMMAGAAVGEVASGGMLLPALAVGGAALAAGSGLYHYAKKYLDADPEDRRGKIIMDNLDARDKRAKNLIGQAFNDDTNDGSLAQAFGV